MKSFALALLIGTPLLSLLSGCGNTSDGDYAAAISWAINGLLPTPARCQEQGIVRGRFEVQDRRGQDAQTIEADCAATVLLSDGSGGSVEFGGFETSYGFQYDVPYLYTVSLVDQAGRPLAPPVNDEMVLYEGEGDFYELPSIDFLQPFGEAAAIHAEWSIGNDSNLASLATCGGIGTVRLLVTTILDPDFVNTMVLDEAPCANGFYDSPGKFLATGAYLMRYEALSAAGSSIDVGDPIEVEVDGSGDIKLPREQFLSNARAPLVVAD